MENYMIELIIATTIVIFLIGLYLRDKSSQKGKLPFSDKLQKH